MQLCTTRHFDRAYANAPPAIKRAFLKQVAVLLDNIRHPSLRAKTYDAQRWQAQVTRDWRFYFRIEGDTYLLLDIMPHPKSGDPLT
jgi:mRNA interferase RelE/StbE